MRFGSERGHFRGSAGEFVCPGTPITSTSEDSMMTKLRSFEDIKCKFHGLLVLGGEAPYGAEPTIRSYYIAIKLQHQPTPCKPDLFQVHAESSALKPSPNFSVPEYYPGKKETLTNIVDFTARRSPQALYAEYLISPTSYEVGYHKINYETLANAVNGFAWYLHGTLGPGENFPTLAYIGPNDMRYNAFVSGAVKAGYKVRIGLCSNASTNFNFARMTVIDNWKKMFYSSPRNSVTAHAHLLDAVACKTILVPDPQPPMIPSILAVFPMKVIKAPTIDELINKTYPQYLYEKSFEQAKFDPLIVFHTSGSTGVPKPVTWNHDYAASYFTMIQLDPPSGYESNDRLVQANRVFLCSLHFMQVFPNRLISFHLLTSLKGANHLITLCAAIATRTAWIYPLASAIPSVKVLADGLRQTTADAALIAPPTAVDLAKDPELLEFVSSRLDTMIFAGGDLPQPFGEAISKKMRLVDVYGASEVGNLPSLRPVGDYIRGDWHYTHFHPDIGLEFRHLSDNLYEMWVVRDQAIEEQQPIFKLFPQLTEYSTCDIYSPHPTKQNLWAYGGRSDDIIVFLTGEKTNPTTMEHTITSHSEVKSVLLSRESGQRFKKQTSIALLTQKLRRHIYFLLDPKRPMGRAGKSTIQRPLTVAMYASELESLYADAEKLKPLSMNPDVKPTEGPLSLDSVSAVLQNLVKSQTGWEKISHVDNFYVVGMDSLQTLLLTRDMKQVFQLPDIAPSTEEAERNRKLAISKFLQLKISFVDEIAASNTSSTSHSGASNGQIVILTGSTGSLGSYLLLALLNNPSVSHIHCLNRSLDSYQLQVERNESRGLQTFTNFSPGRVSFHTINSAQENFGLDTEIYSQLLKTTTKIILNGWSVNFNVPLSSFEQQIDSVINFVKFSNQSSTRPTIFFISSISSVRGISNPESKIPERVINDDDHSAPTKMGYGESKYIANRLLDYAVEKLHIDLALLGLDKSLVRLSCQASGTNVSGSPVLYIGALPDSLGSEFNIVDWLPIDFLADIIVDLTLEMLRVLKEKRVIIPEIMKNTGPLELVPLKEWLKRVAENATRGGLEVEKTVQLNPAVKLLDTYESFSDQVNLPEFEMEKTLESSEKLRGAEPIKPEWIEKWCKGCLV
ncbi:hypothetical protein HYALB_00003833 [Hymenoscyphus albidus]|uniref:Carrier domain-containing protein n=1 Tax=Hymenoscyphus albidus TaxID=595503 RepID=A0A9N9LY71_9HELO|nr:hypothetical protein HYALB_00003833 [Hymenoscyphus albidus]